MEKIGFVLVRDLDDNENYIVRRSCPEELWCRINSMTSDLNEADKVVQWAKSKDTTPGSIYESETGKFELEIVVKY